MDQQAYKQGVRTLEELVLDAGEAVSYRRLASVLCIHVNASKALLQKFVDQHADTECLSVNMLVCGATSGGNARIVMCPRTDLKFVRESLNTVLFEHIYAVSRSSAALEGAALAAAAGGFGDFTPIVGVISNPECVKRSQDEMGKLKLNSYKSLTDKHTDGTPTTIAKDDKKKPVNSLKVDSKKSEISTTANSSAPVTKPVKEESLVQSPKSKESKAAKGHPKKNISNFFNKHNVQASKPLLKVKEEPKDIKPKSKFPATNEPRNGPNESAKTKVYTPVTKKQEKQTKKPQIDTKIHDETQKCEKAVVKKPTKRNEVVTAQRHGKVDKKRKRVLLMSDSEDSDEDRDDPFEETTAADDNMDSDEEIIPATPNADIVKITSGIVNPRKRRKMIDKTYTTEDGYMVTRKEEVLESCSEDEAEMKENIVASNVKTEIVVEKKTPVITAKTNKKNIISPQKKKQASIMNFFKKKTL